MTEHTEKWASTSLRREQYNGLMLLAAQQERPITKMIDIILREAGVPELTSEGLEARLKKVKAYRIAPEAIST